MSRLGPLIQRFKDAPPVLAVRKRRFDRAFRTAVGMSLYRGIFSSFDEARASAPASRPVGYDNTDSARMYEERINRVYPSDYPVLFWLRSCLGPSSRVFDFGGHVGIAYYAYARYLDYPADLKWTICDVPAVVEEGRRMAQARGASALSFVTEPEAAPTPDVFMASGSLQYVETSLSSILGKFKRLPRHVVLNKTPLYSGSTFVTLQSIGTAYCPYWIFNRRAFFDPLKALGYELIDEWENADVGCSVAFEPEHSVPRYTGMYLRLRDEKAEA